MDKLNQSLDLFTEGLRSDPEIRLDIRRELQSHLEEKIAEEAARGHSNEDSLELALKTFGSPVEVADGLAAANRKRMNFRARMRLLAGALLIPAVIICAFFSLNMIFSSIDMINSIDNPRYSSLEKPEKMLSLDIFRRCTPEQEFILYGDRTKKTHIEQQRAIWEKFPDNRIYAANYILSLMSGNSVKDRDFIIDEIRRVSRLDPDNALYNYLAAGVMLKDACNEMELPREKKNAKPQYRFELKDRALLDKAMREYLAGTNKKYCCSYTVDLLKQRLQIMGEDVSITGQIGKMIAGAGALWPQWREYRTIRDMPEYAAILIKEGRKQEALKCMNTWKQFLRHVNFDNGAWFIGVLNTAGIAEADAEKLPPLYERLGMPELAGTVAQNTEALCKPVREWRAKRLNAKSGPSVRGGVLACMLLPGLGHEFTSEELASERYAEYAFLQKIALSMINMELIAGMIFALIAALFWRFRNGSRLLLLAPPPLTILKVLGFGVVLPCVVYFLLAQIKLLSGYDCEIPVSSTRFAGQMLILLLLIPSAVLMLTRRCVAARCYELGVAIPLPDGRIRKIATSAGLALLFIAAFAPLPVARTGIPHLPAAIILLTGLAILTVLIILRIGHWAAALFCDKKHGVYYGAVARMLMLTFALAVLVLTCIFRPILDWREAEFVRQDKIMFGSEYGTRAEEDLGRELKSGIDRAMDGISK